MFGLRLPGGAIDVDCLTDAAIRGAVVARIKRLERGLMGDVEPVGGGEERFAIRPSCSPKTLNVCAHRRAATMETTGAMCPARPSGAHWSASL